MPQNLTPSDWQQLCRAALSGGDHLIWKGEFQERCAQMAAENVRDGHPARNAEMLSGTGKFGELQKHLRIDLPVLAQIATAATAAWKALPGKEGTRSLSQLTQGHSEPFQDYVDRLLQLAERLFGNLTPAMAIVKQLAYENANKYCKNALRSHRNKSLDDYIKICRNIDPTYIQGMVQGQVIAMALRGEGPQGKRNMGGSGDKTCFKCGGSGHFRRDCPRGCPGNPGTTAFNTARRPGLCPRCKRGNHWANDCRSKTDIQGNPLPPPAQAARPQGNWNQALPQGPRATLYGAMNPSAGSGQVCFVRPQQSNPFTSPISSEQPQAVQEWNSVPQPEHF